MKILVYGANGWIGSQFCDIIHNSTNNRHTLIYGGSRLNNIEQVRGEILRTRPTNVFCFTGRTHGKIGEKIYTTIDYLEQDGKLVDNIRDNLFSPICLAKLCEDARVHLTYLGTGCIFKYDGEHPFGKEENGFSESSKPNFFGSGYSIVKGFTDQLMKLFPKTVLNLRIRMPITGTPNPRNFITKITKYDKICSIPNSMTILPELLPLVIAFADMRHCGTVNLTNPGLITHNEILAMYKEIVDPDFEWENFTEEEQSKILHAERCNNFMETGRLTAFFPHVSNIKVGVRKMLEQYKACNPPKIIRPPPTDFPNTEETTLLVTGGCGFIGSNFVNLILERFDKIKLINIDAMYYCANKNNINKKWQISPRYQLIRGNICSLDLVQHIFDTHRPTHVIHFAAQSHVQNSFSDSLQYTQDNIVGTHTILEVARLYGKLQKFIHVSTDEVYGESMLSVDEKHKTEHSVLCPTNPYAATKAGAELIAQSYNHSFKMPIVITRGNNVYGPNQYPEKVIPRFIQQLKNNEKVTIQGDGSCVRAFLHSHDTATAFQNILERGKVGEIYNIGCDEGMEYSIMDVAKLLIKQIQNTEDYDKWITYIEDRPFNDQRYYISNQKLKDLGWEVTIDFKIGIAGLIR